MFRLCLCLGIGVSALLGVLGDPGQAHAQRARGGFHPGFRPMTTRGSRAFFSGSRFTRGFGFDSRFRGGIFDRDFDRRFRGGMIDRRFDLRFRGRMMGRRFREEMLEAPFRFGF